MGDLLLRVTPEVIETMFTRDHAGNRLRVEWGRPDADGFHTPTITVDYTDNLTTTALSALREQVKALTWCGGCWMFHSLDPSIPCHDMAYRDPTDADAFRAVLALIDAALGER